MPGALQSGEEGLVRRLGNTLLHVGLTAHFALTRQYAHETTFRSTTGLWIDPVFELAHASLRCSSVTGQ